MASRPRSAFVLVVAFVFVAACGGTAAPTVGLPGGSSAGASGAPTQAGTAGTQAGASGAPSTSGGTSSQGVGPSAIPVVSYQPASGSPVPTDDAAAVGASACSGNHDNRVFFEAIAGQVTWAVYCAVLPSGWFVQAGSFSLRDGGRMQITYKGPGGALLTLEEGNICEDGASACAVQGQQLGSSAFGDQTGTLTAVNSSGEYGIYVDPGSFPSWSLTATGLDESTFTGFAAALYHVKS